MKIADEIREVLKKLIDTITDGQELAGGECMEIDQALKEILKLKVKLPPYKEITIHTHHNNIQRYSGYNDCLSDVTKLNEE